MSKLSRSYVLSVFEPLTAGDWASFFAQVSDNVEWTVTGGAHPLAGRYTSKIAFQAKSWSTIQGVMEQPMQLRIVGVMVEADESVKGLKGRAVVELKGTGGVLKNGKEYNNEYCWVLGFNDEGVIVSVRAYLDTAKLRDALDGNA